MIFKIDKLQVDLTQFTNYKGKKDKNVCYSWRNCIQKPWITHIQEFKSNLHLLSDAIMCTYRRLHNPLNDVLEKQSV